MRSKIVFLVVFMLSFAIVHDTVLSLLDPVDKTVVSFSVGKSDVSQKDSYLHQIHEMFHFVALMCGELPLEELRTEKRAIAYRVPRFPLPYPQNLVKPPIA